MLGKLTISFIFAVFFLLPQEVGATAYYIDFVNGLNSNAGTATTTAWQSISQFTANARSAGDIAFVRRGLASTTNTAVVNFTSDGTSANPIILQIDYDNLWNGFATTSQTYTFAVGSTTITASSDQSDVVVGDWLYVMGDCTETYNATVYNTCEYSYEVSAVSSTSISFFLPYKGLNSGSGKEVRKMPFAPAQGNITDSGSSVSPNTDNYWVVKGINWRSSNLNGILLFVDTQGFYFVDSLFTGDGSSVSAISCNASAGGRIQGFGIYKSRGQNLTVGFNFVAPCTLSPETFIRDSIFTNGITYATPASATINLFETFFSGTLALPATANLGNIRIYGRNVNNLVFSGLTTNTLDSVFIEDYNNTIGQSVQFSDLANSNTQWIASSTVASSFLRSGGGPKSIQIVPSTNIGPNNFFGWIRLFEYPIYVDTSSKQYDVYFMSTSTAAWTTDPLATELWIECEYWNYVTGATSTRAVKKSTGTVDFNGSTAWQSLSVTCQPTQTGILYLRGWYAKTKEASVMNEFFVDGTPVIQ